MLYNETCHLNWFGGLCVQRRSWPRLGPLCSALRAVLTIAFAEAIGESGESGKCVLVTTSFLFWTPCSSLLLGSSRIPIFASTTLGSLVLPPRNICRAPALSSIPT